MVHNNLFIVFEGCDGVGKSTQVSLLAKYIEEMKGICLFTREPGGTLISQKIREILLSYEIDDPLTEMFLLSAARYEHVKKIRLNLNNGVDVISDRYYYSSLAYQSYVKGLDPKLTQNIIDFSIDGLVPDIVFLLDMDPNITYQRLNKQNHKNISNSELSIERTSNHYDKKDIVFHTKVRNAFLDIANKNCNLFVIIDANQSEDLIHKKIVSELLNRFDFLAKDKK